MTRNPSACTRAPRGWWCTRNAPHDGPCAARPRWWNLRGRRVFAAQDRKRKEARADTLTAGLLAGGAYEVTDRDGHGRPTGIRFTAPPPTLPADSWWLHPEEWRRCADPVNLDPHGTHRWSPAGYDGPGWRYRCPGIPAQEPPR